MAISLRTLDDGAWISVNDSRTVGASDVWTLARGRFCRCEPAYVLFEGFTDVGVDGTSVVAGAVGRCLECGRHDSLERLPVGRIVDGEFERYEASAVQATLEPVSGRAVEPGRQIPPEGARGGEN
ncbi:hypothetical protein [Natronosalvus rutilus]|uniref:DUF8134 domain-containing protein n=1 Tax=Natronosalvus rutilus TaxID=2953753 RepID=A0A9E7NC51_9EURY|nr:hypothetical protein [Natronosalvus rutilus]UTF54263.1 hypothetical protein NGM29_02955 [Natronosalvus rutilus]